MRNVQRICVDPIWGMFFSLIFATDLLAGGLFESQVLPPGWLLRNQLSGVDGRMRR